MSNAASPALQVSFIIPAMNEATLIVGALDSIRRLRPHSEITVAEVIVVDSGSTDATPDIARAAGCHVVSAAAGNVAASRNLGAAGAVGNILAFLDADCELPASWLEQIAAEFRDQAVVATGMQMAAPASDATWVEHSWYTLAHSTGSEQESRDTDWLATFNLAVRADAFHGIGGFDETLATCEDVDLGYRLGEGGRLRVIAGDGVVHHGESKTLKEFFRREAWRARGGWLLLKQHGHSLREVISCLLPFVVTGSMATTFTAIWWTGPVALLGLLPLFALVLRRRPAWNQLPAALTLQAVYAVARCRGMLHPAPRVERPEAPGQARDLRTEPEHAKIRGR